MQGKNKILTIYQMYCIVLFSIGFMAFVKLL